MSLSRRTLLAAAGTSVPLLAAVATVRAATPLDNAPATPIPPGEPVKVWDKVELEWVMDIVPICSKPEPMGDEADQTASDGNRHNIWPIVGGVFRGRGIRGKVIPGGGDFPVIRPDGVMVVDALYRLQTDDGRQIIIHNKGLGYRGGKFRLLPTFNVVGKTYAWLRESAFVATLVYPLPPEIELPNPADRPNARLIQVFRLA